MGQLIVGGKWGRCHAIHVHSPSMVRERMKVKQLTTVTIVSEAMTTTGNVARQGTEAQSASGRAESCQAGLGGLADARAHAHTSARTSRTAFAPYDPKRCSIAFAGGGGRPLFRLCVLPPAPPAPATRPPPLPLLLPVLAARCGASSAAFRYGHSLPSPPPSSPAAAAAAAAAVPSWLSCARRREYSFSNSSSKNKALLWYGEAGSGV
eukprot:COSAG05_NODE_4675_length_1415_cov_1.666413_1_plen_208_part_00